MSRRVERVELRRSRSGSASIAFADERKRDVRLPTSTRRRHPPYTGRCYDGRLRNLRAKVRAMSRAPGEPVNARPNHYSCDFIAALDEMRRRTTRQG